MPPPDDILQDERARIAPSSSSGDAVITTDVKGHITFLNPVAQTLTGWTLNEALDVPLEALFIIVNEDTRAAVENPAAKVLREGGIVSVADHSLLIAKDGTELPIDSNAVPVLNQAREITSVVLVFRDVTERRRNERILRESEERFHLLVEGAKDYEIITLDPHGIVASWNSGAERISGYKADEIIGQHFSRFYPPDVAGAGFPQTQLRTAAMAGRFEDEGWRRRKDGSQFLANVIVTALRDDDGILKGFAKVTRDLAERRMAEETLRSHEQSLRALTQHANDAIISADASGKITSWNPAAMTIFGYSEGEALGRSIALLIPDRRRGAEERDWERLRSAADQLIGRTIELSGRRKDGSSFPLELSLAAWTTEQGRFYSAIIRDIAERKQKEHASRQSEVLADLNNRKDEFLAMLSHEMRNPLAPIRNALQLLRLGKNGEPMRQQAMDVLERQVSHLTRLVDDLLKISHIATGKIGLQQERLDARAVVERAVELVRPSVVEKKHELTVSLPANPVWLYADPVRIEQVLVNLLTNATKYTNVGGRIRLKVEQKGHEMVISVADNGMGIARDFLPSVFDLFTQAPGSLNQSQGGLGVGLSIVQRIVKMHGGTVDAVSAGPGRGSEFTVRLPVASPPLADSKLPPSTSTQQTIPALRVLVVDDNHDTANSIAMLLRHTGHDVRVAYDGASAIQTACEYLPESVLLDIGLPDLDGYEVARRLRQHPDLKTVRLVAVTGYGRETDRQRAHDAGFDAYLVKPAHAQQIQEFLRA